MGLGRVRGGLDHGMGGMMALWLATGRVRACIKRVRRNRTPMTLALLREAWAWRRAVQRRKA